MSRLKGRITFPEVGGSSHQSTNTGVNSDARETSSGIRKDSPPSGDKPRRRGRGFNQVKQEEEGRPDRQARFPPQHQYERSARHERGDRSDRNQRSERVQQHPKTDRSEPKEQEKPRKPISRVEDVVASEELLELEDIITQISDLSVRSDRSAVQIKRNILASTDLIDTMDEDDWQKVCESMVGTALEQDEPEFIADIIVALFQTDLFAAVMSDELMAASSKHIMEQNDKPLPTFLAAILCAHWPRQYAKAFDNVNPVLYTVVCIIKGWILVVSEDTERYYKEKEKPKITARTEDAGEEEKDNVEEEKEEEKIIENPEIVNKCAVALCDLCDTAQRQLWVSWMGVTDEIYQCIKPTITHNANITGAVKARLLDTFVQMNQWTKTRAPSVKHAKVQTVSLSTSTD